MTCKHIQSTVYEYCPGYYLEVKIISPGHNIGQTILKISPGQADLPEYPHGQVTPKQCSDSEFTTISNNKN